MGIFLTSMDATNRESSALSNGEIETVSKFARNSNFSREKETGSKTIRVRVEFLPVPHSSLQPPHNTLNSYYFSKGKTGKYPYLGDLTFEDPHWIRLYPRNHTAL